MVRHKNPNAREFYFEKMYKKLLVLVAGMILLKLFAAQIISYIYAPAAMVGRNPSGGRVVATVGKVIDGDTIELANGDRIRLLGIDAPEKGDYNYYAAAGRLKELIINKTIELEKDVNNKDGFDRLLRYVFVDDGAGSEVFVNLQLVREGYAYAYVVAPDDRYIDELVGAENEARAERRGIWQKSVHDDCIVVDFHYNARGDDTENMNDEYVVFKNVCSQAVEMTAWEVKDAGSNTYKFPDLILGGGQLAILYSGAGEDGNGKFYWDSELPVWNNDGDTLYLRDSDAKLILKQSYRRKD